MAYSKAYKAGQEHFDNVGDREAPLSGEWAGESILELSHVYGVDLEDEWHADEFERGFWERREQNEHTNRSMVGHDYRLPSKAVVWAETALEAAAFTVEHERVMPGEKIVVAPVVGETFVISVDREVEVDSDPVLG